MGCAVGNIAVATDYAVDECMSNVGGPDWLLDRSVQSHSSHSQIATLNYSVISRQ